MIRISGVNIPSDKLVPFALRYIHGVGPKVANDICEKLSISSCKRAKDLSESEISGIAVHLSGLTIEGALRRQVSENISALGRINNYRGLRHRYKLPVRGQNSKNNSRTRKGKKKIAIAGKS
jgi:small subunit ribosomal protein S13